MTKKNTATRMVEWICSSVIGTSINVAPSYECRDCGARFDEPEEQCVNAADYYGVGSEFGPSSGYLHITVCPRCGSEEFEEVEEYEEGGEE